MKKAILKSLMILAATLPSFAWAAVVYQNPLAGSDQSLKFGQRTYYATPYSELTMLVEDEKLGNFDEVIKEVGGDNDTQTHSVSLWVKLATLTDDQILWWVCGGSNTEHGGYAVKAMADGKLRIGKANANGTWNETNYLTTADSCLSANTWAHVTVTIAKTENARTATPVVYVNGVAKMFSGTATTFPTNLNGNGGTSTYAQVGAGVTAAGMKVYNEAVDSATVAADYADRTNLTQLLPNPVYLLDAGKDATEGWTQINKNNPYPAFLEADTTNGSIYVTTTSGGNFFNTYGTPANGFVNGTYKALNGVTYTSVFEEMAATLGITSVPETVLDNLVNGGYTDHVVTVSGLDSEKTYVMYYIGGADKDNQSVAGFTLQADGYTGSPKVEYVCTSGGTNTSTVTEYTSVSATTAMRAAKDGYLLVRASYICPKTDGTIQFSLSGDRSNICALAIAEINPLPPAVIHERSIDSAGELWSTESEWENGTLPVKQDIVTLTATVADATLNIDVDATVDQLTVAGTQALKMIGSGTLKAASTTVSADTDVSGITASLGRGVLAENTTLRVKTPSVFTSFTGTTTSVVETTESFTLNSSLEPENMTIRVANGTLTLGHGAWINKFAVASGATLDLNGKGNWRDGGAKTAPLITLENGGTLKSSTDMGHDTAVLNELALTEGATATITGKNFRTVAPGHGKTAIALNGGTLNIQMDPGFICHFYNMCAVKTPDELSTGRSDNPPEATDYAGTINFQSGDFYFLATRILFGRAAFVFDPLDGETIKATISVPTELGSLAGEAGTLIVNNTLTVGALKEDTEFAGVITGASSITKVGSGTLTLSGENTFSGEVVLSEGGITVAAAKLTTGKVTVNGTLTYTKTDATLTNEIHGTGTITADGHTLTLTGANLESYTGSVCPVNNGVIELGETRLTTATVSEASVGTIRVTATAAEIDAEELVVAKVEGTEVPDGLQVEVTAPEGSTLPAWELMVKGGKLMLSTEAVKTVTWQTPASGSNWEDGLPGFAIGDNATFGANSAQEPVTVTEGIAVENVTVQGNYFFEGEDLNAASVTVEKTGTLTLYSESVIFCNYVRLTASNTNTAGNAPALSELILTKNGETVPWPVGTTIIQENSNGTTTAPVWGSTGNEKVNALIDTVYSGSGNPEKTYTNPVDNSTGTYNGGVGTNKWWPTDDQNAAAKITLGSPIEFDGYRLMTADHNPRSPKNWTLEVSVDGENWVVFDTQTDHATPAPNNFYVYEAGNTIFPVNRIFQTEIVADTVTVKGTLTAASVITADTIIFEADSRIAVSEANNGPLTLNGAVTIPDGATVTVTVPDALAEAARLPFLKTTNDLPLEKFTCADTHYIFRDDDVYYIGNAGKKLYATVDGSTAWSNLVWKNAVNVTITAPNFSSGDVAVELSTTADAELELDATVTLADLTYTGTHTLTLTGSSKLTVSQLSVTGGTLKAGESTVNLPPATIAAEATLDYAFTTGGTIIPPLSGAGTFVKRGNVIALLGIDNTYEAKLVAAEGTLKLYEGKAYNIEVRDGARLQTDWSGTISSAEAKILLKGGATFAVYCGDATYGSELNAAITIEASEDKPAKILGAGFGNNAVLAGPIFGTGAVEFGTGPDMGNFYTVNGQISGNLKVIVSTSADFPVIFAGENTYSGGTEIAESGVLAITNASALGSGKIIGAGRLECRNLLPVNRSGLNESDWTGTVALKNVAPGAKTGYTFYNLGNAGSILELNNFATATSNVYLNEDNELPFSLKLVGNNYITNGNSNRIITIAGKLLGEGALIFNTHGGNPTETWKFAGEATDFTGMISVSNNRRVVFGEATGDNGVIVIASAVDIHRTWTATNGFSVTSTGTLSGFGTLSGTVTLASGATIRTDNGILTATGTVTLPTDKLNVVLPENIAGDVKILSADSITVSGTPVADVYVGSETVVSGASLEVLTDGLYLMMARTYVREFSGAAANWVEPGAWTVGETTANEPLSLASVELTMAADTIVSSRKPIALTQLTFAEEGTGRLTLEFDLSDMLTDANYLAAPFTLELLKVSTGIDFDRVAVQTSGLKYGAIASITTTDTAVIATVTLPENICKTESISINFAHDDATKLSGTGSIGLKNYQMPVDLWTEFTTASGTDQPVTRVTADGEAESHSALTFTAAGTAASGNSDPILAGYLDGGDAGAVLSLTIPAAWETYSVVIYTAATAADAAFTAKRVNGTTYSYVDGRLVESDAAWGSTKARTELVEGQNVMVIPNLTGRILQIEGLAEDSTVRGGIAAVQIFYRDVNLDLAPDVCRATISGECAWSNLNWDPMPPTSATIAELTLAGDAVMDLTGSQALQVSVVGRGHSFTLTGIESEAAKWVFTTDTVLAMKSEASLIPSFITAYPGTVRYTYNYTAPEGGFTTNPNYTTEFAAGFSGILTPAGGGVNFSAGAVALQKVNLSSVQTAITFSGTSRTTAPESLTFSQAAVRVYGSAQVTSPALALADGEKGNVTRVSIEDDAIVTVTGDQNDHNSTNAESSLSLTAKEGSATLTLSGNGRLIAEKAEMVLADSGDAMLEVNDNAEVRVKGLVHKHADAKTSNVILRGGRLLVGESTFRTLADGKTIGLTMGGGAIGALSGTVEWDAAADAAMTLADSATINFASEPGATLAITSKESAFLSEDEITNLSGGLRLKDMSLGMLTLTGGTLEVVGNLDISVLTTGTDATGAEAGISFDGGVLTTDDLTFNGNTTLSYPLRDRLSTGGYIVMRDGKAMPADLSKVTIALVLDADRGDTEKLLPEYPLIIGTRDTSATPAVRGVGLTNNSNGAITDHKLVYFAGDLGNGLYVTVEGDEVLKVHTVNLTDPTDGYSLVQSTVDAYPYHYFTATEAGARLKIPASGIALSHITFSGEATRIVSQATAPATILHSNHISITSNLIFDLSAWTDEALDAFVRGAVRDVPASTCLVASGITLAPGVTLSVDFGTDENNAPRLPDGFTAEIAATPDGIYLVVTADRAARVLPVNFTTAEFPLTADPANPGAYPIASTEWNTLSGSFSASSLLRTDASGIAIVPAADAEGMPTQLLVYNSKAVTSDAASASMLKAWIRDSADQEIRFANLPFAAYRVALIFSNDLEGAAYAPVVIGDDSYCMDGEGYLRKNIAPYRETIPGDTQWGSTDFTETDSPFVPGHNILVTDVLTDPSLKIQLPASVYGLTYSGLAALQIIEAPATVEVVTTDQYAYTFTKAGEHVLSTLDLTMNGGSGKWVNSRGNTLTLTSEHDVTVTLPEDFTAATVVLAGSGHITLQVAHGGGAQIGTLNAFNATDVTVHFDCTDVEFTAPAPSGVSVMTFERGFNNNGEPYTIAAGATLVLGEAFGGTTSLDVAAGVTPKLAIADASAGTLRRNYELQVTESYSGWEDLTLAFANGTRAPTTDSDELIDSCASPLLVETGDEFNQYGLFQPLASKPWTYTQTGGKATFLGDTENTGMVFFDSASAATEATLKVSGGILETAAVSAGTAGTTVTLNVSNKGTLKLGYSLFGESFGGLGAKESSSSLTVTFSDDATLDLAAGQLSASGDGTVKVTFTGGRITTELSEATLAIPVEFAGTAEAPTELAPAVGSTLVLDAENRGTGSLAVTQGTVTIANASALDGKTATIAGGATLEVRANVAAMTDTKKMAKHIAFSDGSTLSVWMDSGDTAKIAGTIAVTDAVRYMLNGKLYSEVEVEADGSTGTVRFITEAARTDVSWKPDVDAGIWENGFAGPWADKKVYLNEAVVTFPAPNAPTTVTVRGALTPSAIIWGDGSEDQYTFTAADSALLTLSGATVNMNSGLIWNLPVATEVNAELQGGFNTYRLIGALSNGNKTATLVGSGNVNGASGNHGVWCTNGATLAPKRGETQIVAIMAKNPLNTDSGVRSQMTGEQDVIITGGGTVQFSGNVGGGAANVPYQNKGFSGKIIVTDDSTLDFTMTRQTETAQNNVFFAMPTDTEGPTPGGPRYTGEGVVGLSVRNGGTVRFSGCRNIYGGYANRENEALLASRPIEIGYKGMVDFAHNGGANYQQTAPFGFSFIGDGATLTASEVLFLSAATTFKVAGIGEPGDPANPDVEFDDDPESETTGKHLLTTGITAEVAGADSAGLLAWNTLDWTKRPLTLDVGTGSTLKLSAPLVTGVAGALTQFTFRKTGLGRLAFTRPTQTMPVTLSVEEGILGGTTTFADAQVTMTEGTVLEAGLSIPRLTLADEVTLKVDPTGETVISTEMAAFTAGGVYTVASLIDPAKIPAATGRLPVKVMGWTGTQSANSVSFMLDEVLETAGYSPEVRADGLYLKQGVTFVRELEITEAAAEYRVAWYAPEAWYRLADLSRKPQDADKVMCDYDPDETDAATALFILPEIYAPGAQADGSTLMPPTMTLILTREVAVAKVRFAVWTKDAEQNDVLHTLSVPVVYHYNLMNETMPGENDAKSFTWVPTLVVENSNTATVSCTVPTGYAYSQRDATVVVYASATKPAINVNFTGAASGEASWIATDADPSGIVPFAGVYWNNASTEIGGGGDYLGGDDTHTVFLTRAVVAGVEPTEDNQAVTAEVTYLTAGAGSVPARRGAGNVTLAASYLHGNRGKPKENNPFESEEAVIPSNEILASAGMDSADVESGWQVKVDSVPFSQYDLYLLFAGNTDDAVVYPAVRIKVGEEAWCTYSMVHGWAASASRKDSWNGRGGLVDGTFRDGMNVLHFRFSAPSGSAIQIAPVDNSQSDEAAAQAVGLAALQIVACTDGAANERLGTGKWSDAAGWRRTLADSTQETGRWLDATAEAPRYAQIQTTSSLAADMVAQTPYLALSGTSTMRLLGTAGVLSTGTVDLRKVNPTTTIHFEEDVFADAPNVILAPDITFTLPEGAETRTNSWRWIYDEVDDSASAILQKRNSGDLIINRMMLNELQIDDGTLWLSTAIDNPYTRHTVASGDGIFGKTGPGDLKMEWNLLRTTGASGGVIARCNQGFLYLVSRGEVYRQIQSLPAGTTVVAEGAGTIIFEAIQESLRQPFDNGIMKAVNGGTIRLRKATNMFANSFAPAVGFDWQKNPPPSARLENGRFYVEISGGVHPHITGLTSTGNSSLYFDYNNAGAWDNEGLVMWSGRLEVESGNLGLHANTDHHNSLAIRAVEDFGHGDGSYIHVAGGATLYSDLPIQAGKDGANQLLRKTGSGIWVQTCSISPGRGNNGGSESLHAADIVIHEGTFRLNLGADIFAQYPTSATRTITVKGGARMDGAGEIDTNTHAYINTGATLASGIPDEWVGISSACPGYIDMPAKFKQEPGNSIHRLFFLGNVIFADDAILEIDLAESALLAIDTPTFDSNLVVRLKNLPATLTKDVQLTDFKNGPTNGPLINCPEALALDAEVVWENGNLWLKPSEAAYLWADQIGSWSEPKWSFGDSTVSFPYDATMKPPQSAVARVQALTAPVVLAVDKGPDTSDGRNWPLKALILSAEQQPITISEPPGALNTLHVESTVWKLGEGQVTVSAPIAFFSTGTASMLNVVKGNLTLTHPLTLLNASGSLTTTLPTAIEILKGASLTYALAATDADPLTQTLSGPLSGEGTLVVNQAGTQVTLTGNTDSGVNYDVQAGTLIVAPATAIAQAETTVSRTVTVAAGAELRLNAETALGWAKDINWTLTAGEGATGAKVSTSEGTSADARVRGTVTVVKPDSATGAVTAALGTGNTYLDGDFTAIVPGGATLSLGGTWQTPKDCLAGAVTKRGAGELTITGSFGSNLPVTVAEGSVRVTGTVDAENLNNATMPNWTVEKGAALVAATSASLNFRDGSLTIRNGARLDTVDQAPKFVARDGIHFEDGALFALGEASMTAVQPADFQSAVTVNGVVIVDLDRLDPERLTKGTHPLITFTGGRSGGTFMLGGSNLVKWAEKGWSLQDYGARVTLEPFGGTDGFYTWAGDDSADATGAGNWSKPFWVAPNGNTVGDWPEASATPSVTLQDTNPINSERIPDAARTLEWNLAEQSLVDFRCANNRPDGAAAGGDYTLTAAATAESPTLSVTGIFLKTGNATLTVNRPVKLGKQSALNILGGEAVFSGALTPTSGNLENTITIGGGATLRFTGSASRELMGLLDGDGTGTLANDGGMLKLTSDLSALKALQVQGGTVALTAAEQYAVAPAVTVADGGVLRYAPATLSGGGDVMMSVNAEATTPAGVLLWQAAADAETARTPRLAAPVAAGTAPAVNVAELRYAPESGHLILDPGQAVLPKTATITLRKDPSENDALWMGARTDAGSDFVYSGLTGTGLLSVEPVIDPYAAADWARTRTFTLELNPAADEEARTFNGRISGAYTLAGEAITAGLTVLNADNVGDTTAAEARFTLTNSSTAETLGLLTVGEKVRTEVTGSWTGDVTVSDGGTIAGSGTLGAAGRTVTVPAGAALSASFYGRRQQADGTFKAETIPATLTVNGTLSLESGSRRGESGSRLGVLLRKNLQGVQWTSCVEADHLLLPTVLAEGEEAVQLRVDLDIEANAYTRPTKILGWKTISGVGKINGTVYVNGQQTTDYILKQKSDGLYLQRSAARFWMILR